MTKPHALTPYSPKLADLTLIQLQDAWMVERNEDYRAIAAPTVVYDVTIVSKTFDCNGSGNSEGIY